MHTSHLRSSVAAIVTTMIVSAPFAGAQMIQFPEGFPFTNSNVNIPTIVNAAPVNTINNGNSFNAAINQAAPVVHVQQNPVQYVAPVAVGSTGYKTQTTQYYVERPTYKTVTYDRPTYKTVQYDRPTYKTVQYDRPTYKTVRYKQPEVRYVRVEQPRYKETVRYVEQPVRYVQRQASAPIYVEPRIQYVRVLPQTGVETFTDAIATAGTALRPMAASAKEASASLWIALSSIGMSAGAALGKKFFLA